MLYVLTIGWQWFAGAAALGLAAGFALTPSAPGRDEAGGWAATAAALALLAAIGAAAAFGAAPGRDGLLLDIAFLAGFAYVAGLPAGQWAKRLTAGPAAAPASAPKVEPTPEPPPAESAGSEPVPEPPAAASAEPEPAPVETPVQPPEPAAPAPAEEAKPAPRNARKAPVGIKPESLSAPRGDPDDLCRIKGLGPKSVEKLHALGIFHIDQIAVWNLENARWISAALGSAGRVERGKWIQQAREIVAAAKAAKNQ